MEFTQEIVYVEDDQRLYGKREMRALIYNLLRSISKPNPSTHPIIMSTH